MTLAESTLGITSTIGDDQVQMMLFNESTKKDVWFNRDNLQEKGIGTIEGDSLIIFVDKVKKLAGSGTIGVYYSDNLETELENQHRNGYRFVVE